MTETATTPATDQTWSTNGYARKLSACIALPVWSTAFEPRLSTCWPTSTATGSESNEASESASPTWTRERSVVARKKIIDTGIHTPDPTASMPIAVTNLRCSPTAGKPRP